MAAMSQPALVPSSTPAIVPGQPLRATAEQAARAAERSAITDALRATDGNKSQAAKMLQTDYKTLHVKIKQLGINVKDFGR